MPHFFCEAVTGDRAVITGEDARHIAKVLRMRLGEGLTLSAADGMDYDCVIEGLSPELVELCIQRAYPNETEPRAKVTLFQCVPKSDKMDWIVQKAVELGVFEVVPVLSKRCVSRPDAKTAAKKVERWQKIAKEAAKQSGRGIIPVVRPMITFAEALKEAGAMEFALFCYEGGGDRLSALVSPTAEQIALLIGSEGGFEPEEAEAAKEAGCHAATLGKRILRCETAPLAALAAVMQLTGDL